MAGLADPGIARTTASGFRSEWAAPNDDPALRELLRARVMEGAIGLTLEREPSFFHAQAIEGDRHHTIVGRNTESGEIIGMGTRSTREVWVNGERGRLGYLGALRAAPGRRGLTRLAAGYRALATTRLADELPFDLTSVVSDNTVARRLLERGLPGLPRYTTLCDFRTLLIPTRRHRATRGSSVTAATPEDIPEIVDCLARNFRRYQFAPAWSRSDLMCDERCRALRVSDFAVVRERNRIVACAARWDQRRFKQVVVRGYSPWLRRVRPILNLAFTVYGRPRLPTIGSRLPLAYVSHLAVDEDRADLALALFDALRQRSTSSDVEILVAGFALGHPLLGPVQREYPARSYRSRIYRVQWPEVEDFQLDERIPHLEVATL